MLTFCLLFLFAAVECLCLFCVPLCAPFDSVSACFESVCVQIVSLVVVLCAFVYSKQETKKGNMQNAKKINTSQIDFESVVQRKELNTSWLISCFVNQQMTKCTAHPLCDKWCDCDCVWCIVECLYAVLLAVKYDTFFSKSLPFFSPSSVPRSMGRRRPQRKESAVSSEWVRGWVERQGGER